MPRDGRRGSRGRGGSRDFDKLPRDDSQAANLKQQRYRQLALVAGVAGLSLVLGALLFGVGLGIVCALGAATLGAIVAQRNNSYMAGSRHKESALPPGWVEEFDEERDQLYWYHEDTQESVWERPKMKRSKGRPSSRSVGGSEQGGFSVGTPVKIWSQTAGKWEEGVIISAKDDVVTASYRT
jgi:hypothetical protein